MAKQKIERMGDIMLEFETVISKMILQHDLQHGDVYGLVEKYLEVHFPKAKEEYLDGTCPVLYYGPREGLKRG